MAGSSEQGKPVEYHVVYVEEPYPRWEVKRGERRMGYKTWNKRVALSAANEMAKSDRPSKVIVYDHKAGNPQIGYTYDKSSPKEA